MDIMLWFLLLTCIYLVGVITGLVVLKIRLKREEYRRLIAEIQLVKKKKETFRHMLDQNSKFIKNFENHFFCQKIKKEIDDLIDDL